MVETKKHQRRGDAGLLVPSFYFLKGSRIDVKLSGNKLEDYRKIKLSGKE